MKRYRFNWKNNPKRAELYGRECIIIATGKMNSVQVEFIDNRQREVVSRFSLREVKG